MATGVDFQIVVVPRRERPPAGLCLTQHGSSAHLTNRLWLEVKELGSFHRNVVDRAGKERMTRRRK